MDVKLDELLEDAKLKALIDKKTKKDPKLGVESLEKVKSYLKETKSTNNMFLENYLYAPLSFALLRKIEMDYTKESIDIWKNAMGKPVFAFSNHVSYLETLAIPIMMVREDIEPYHKLVGDNLYNWLTTPFLKSVGGIPIHRKERSMEYLRFNRAFYPKAILQNNILGFLGKGRSKDGKFNPPEWLIIDAIVDSHIDANILPLTFNPYNVFDAKDITNKKKDRGFLKEAIVMMKHAFNYSTKVLFDVSEPFSTKELSNMNKLDRHEYIFNRFRNGLRASPIQQTFAAILDTANGCMFKEELYGEIERVVDIINENGRKQECVDPKQILDITLKCHPKVIYEDGVMVKLNDYKLANYYANGIEHMLNSK